MGVLLDISWILIALTSFFTLLNFFTVRVPRYSPSVLVSEKVSILVPLRNEAENVEGVIHSLIAQEGLENFEILALDDFSSDQTLTLLQDICAKSDSAEWRNSANWLVGKEFRMPPTLLPCKR